MKIIFRTEFGSKVYGTNIATSDTDYKSVFIPDPKDIILQRVPKVVTSNTKKDGHAKNTAVDVDDEAVSLQQYLKLLAEGQTPMLDMLFMPERHWIVKDPIWEELRRNKDKLVTKQLSAIVGYVNQQAAKYGIKGSRMAAVKTAIEQLQTMNPNSTLDQFDLASWVYNVNSEHVQIVMVDEKTKGVKPYLEVCGRKAPMNGKVKHALAMFQNIYEQYGHRARQAMTNEGVDWKACYHAIRVATEAEELLLTGQITFPRPEAPLLLKIRKGELPYKEVGELIEQGLARVEAAQLKSTLREKADLAWIDDFVMNAYLAEIRRLTSEF